MLKKYRPLLNLTYIFQADDDLEVFLHASLL